MDKQEIFFSYSKADSEEFALLLATDLPKAGANIWIDQLNLRAGENYNRAIEKALNNATCVLFIVSEKSIVSEYVLDEVHYAIEEKKIVIPIITYQCKLPLRLRGLQHIDFIKNYIKGLNKLLASLSLDVKDDDKIIIPKKDKDTAIEDHSSNVNHIKWVYSENRSHLFDQPTEDYFCPFDPPFHGILSPEEFGQETKLHSNRSDKEPDSKG